MSKAALHTGIIRPLSFSCPAKRERAVKKIVRHIPSAQITPNNLAAMNG